MYGYDPRNAFEIVRFRRNTPGGSNKRFADMECVCVSLVPLMHNSVTSGYPMLNTRRYKRGTTTIWQWRAKIWYEVATFGC